MLVVCTGNICRSALAERLGRAYLEEALAGGADAIDILSAGTRAVVDSAMHPFSAQVLEGLGGRPDGFRARQLRAEHVDGADLVLVMTHRHRDAVLALSPRALARTFLLVEAAELAVSASVGPHSEASTVPERAQLLVAAMARARGRRPSSPTDDVPDPIGQPIEVHDQVGTHIAGALLPLLGHLVTTDGAVQEHRPLGEGGPESAQAAVRTAS